MKMEIFYYRKENNNHSLESS